MQESQDDGEVHAGRKETENNLGKHSLKHSMAQKEKQDKEYNAKIYNVDGTLARYER